MQRSRVWGGLVFVLVGGWMIVLAIQGYSPAGILSGGSRVLALCLGLAFGFGGLMGLTLALAKGGQVGIRVAAGIQTFSFLSLGTCFLVIGIFFPDEIGLWVHGDVESGTFQISTVGRTLFILIGIITFLCAPLICKGMIRLLGKSN